MKNTPPPIFAPFVCFSSVIKGKCANFLPFHMRRNEKFIKFTPRYQGKHFSYKNPILCLIKNKNTMKKFFLRLKLFVVACILGISSGAYAQSYEADESSPLITTVSPEGDTQLTSNCTWEPEEGNDNNIEENNAAFYSVGNYLGTLIDGSQQTYWHSDPNRNLNNEDLYIQVDLMRNDLARMYFMLNRRNDYYTPSNSYRKGVTPVHLDIQATNTPEDESSWKLVKQLTDIPPSMDDSYNWPYMTMLEFDQPYQYLRLIPRLAATASLTDKHAYWTISEIQFYPVKLIEDNAVILQNLVDSIYDLKRDYQAGTTPGYVSEEALATYNDKFAAALDVLDTSTSQEELAAAIVSLRQAYYDINAAVIPLTEGYYFIESAYENFITKQKAIKAFYSSDTNLFWGTLNEEDPSYYYYVKPLEDGNYSIRCGANDMYINTVDGDAKISTVLVPMSKTDTLHQVITPIGNGSYYLSNTKNKNVYHPLSNNAGAGMGGNIVPASIWEEVSTWKFVAADASNLDELINNKKKQEQALALIDSLKEPRLTSFNIKSPTNGLITAASQMSSNCVWSSGNDVNTLIDGDHGTHFHSTTAMNLNTDDEYLQVDLNRSDLSKFTIEYWGRNDGAGKGVAWHDSPNKFIVKATNTPDDAYSWKEITTLSNGFPDNVDDAHYVSPLIDMKAAYQYVRFYVKSTTSGNSYWNLSEFQLYPETIEAASNSLYTKVPEMKKAIDDLDAIIKKADEHINNLTIDGTELAGISEPLAVINDLINSTDRIQAIVNNATTLARKLYVNNTSEDIGLIKEVNTRNDGTNQLSSNCTWLTITEDNDNYSYNEAFIKDNYNLLGALIDNDDQTYWHSNPSGFSINSSEGYLQIDLKRNDVSSFAFRIDRRNDLYNGNNRRGTAPRTAIIYATNDDAIGGNVDGACSEWTKVAELSDMPDPNIGSYWPYFTDEITPDQPYRYLRFRFTSAIPSYAYVSFSGFQVIEGKDLYDLDNSQYSYVEGMKAAADKMNSLAKAVQAKLDEGTATITDGQELQEAIDAVEALYQDKDAFASLISEGQKLVENTETGDEIGQLTDEQLLINLDEAIVNAESSEKYTSSEEFNKVKTALENAIEAVYDNIKSVEPGKWYYIKSETDDEDSAPANYYGARDEVKGTALYVLSKIGKGETEGDYGSNAQLRWGMDDIKNVPTEGDIDALWRFVEVPDSLGYGKRAYYIQNMRTGWYMGNAIAGSDCYISESSKPYPYRVVFIGRNQFNIETLSGNHPNKIISFGDNARQIRVDDIASDYNNRASLTFEEFSADEYPQIALRYENNSARIVTLPFAVRGLDLNDNVHAFQIHSQPSETTIGLVEKTEFEAGEPFILVVGDTTQYADNSDVTEIMVETPSDLSIVTDTVNGLVPALDGAVLSASGYGYFNENVLCVSDSTKKSVSIYAHSGYITPGLITAMDGEPDVVINVFGDGILNSIKKAVLESKTTVDVYTVDGTLVKRNVKAADATKGLAKGIYVVGKKKVLVK